MPVVEFLSFLASETYINDPSILNPALEEVSKVDGCLKVTTGFQDEDKKTLYIVIIWESYAHHKTLIDSPSYPGLTAKLVPSIGGPMQMHHVEFQADPNIAISAPSTEILLGKLHEGYTMKDLAEALQNIEPFFLVANEKAAGELGAVVHPPACFGVTLEDSEKYVVILGWKSTAAHFATVSAPELKGPLDKLKKVYDVTMAHALLTTYTV